MKKLIQFLFPVILLFFLFDSCKKDDANPPEEQKYRLITEEFFSGSGHIDKTEYSYLENRISRLEHQDGGHLFVFDYSYEDAKVLAETMNYTDSILKQEGRIEYKFENDLLMEIDKWKKNPSDWINTFKIEYDYEGENLDQYIETNVSNPYAKGVYQYENNRLAGFDAYHYTNGWVKWIVDEFHYSGDTLKEFYSTIATVGVLEIKMVYLYQNGLLKQINSFVKNDGEWELTYLTIYDYDENDNAILEEVRFASDSSLFHHTEYGYEEGASNLESIIYTGIPDDPDLIYPRPMSHFPNQRLLERLLKEEKIK